MNILMYVSHIAVSGHGTTSYPAESVTDADYADDLALLANAPPQAKSLLCSIKLAARYMGLYLNSDKTEFLCFNQDITIMKCH